MQHAADFAAHLFYKWTAQNTLADDYLSLFVLAVQLAFYQTGTNFHTEGIGRPHNWHLDYKAFQDIGNGSFDTIEEIAQFVLLSVQRDLLYPALLIRTLNEITRTDTGLYKAPRLNASTRRSFWENWSATTVGGVLVAPRQKEFLAMPSSDLLIETGS